MGERHVRSTRHRQGKISYRRARALPPTGTAQMSKLRVDLANRQLCARRLVGNWRRLESKRGSSFDGMRHRDDLREEERHDGAPHLEVARLSPLSKVEECRPVVGPDLPKQ
jgi:hypothetical protein